MCWSNNVANSHPSPGALNRRVLRSCLVPQWSHPLHWPRHQRRLANCDWMPASHTSEQPSHPHRHPTCWASSQRSHAVSSTPSHGARTPASLSALLSIKRECTASQIWHPFVPAAQQLISSSDDNNRSEVECGKVRENYETPYFRTRPNLLERLCQKHRGSGSTASALMSDVSVPACTNGVWALSEACECGAEKQTVAHVVLQCPMHRPSHGMHNWLSAQRLPRDLVRPSSGLKKLPQTMMMFALYCYLYVGISWACIL